MADATALVKFNTKLGTNKQSITAQQQELQTHGLIGLLIFKRAMLRINAIFVVNVCLSIRLSVFYGPVLYETA